MIQSNVIKKPLLSEKAYKEMEKGVYTFLVDKRANKKEISKAVKIQFGADAKKVNVSNLASKVKRIARTRKTVEIQKGKKAIVLLAAGQTISSLLPKKESSKPKKEKQNKTDDSKTDTKNKGILGKLRKEKPKEEKGKEAVK